MKDVLPSSIFFGFDNSYARLPETFYARVNPSPVAAPHLIRLNVALAEQLRLDLAALASTEGIEILAGNRIAEGSEPLAMAYAGHQFGYFVRQLGDGRANLLGEVIGRDGFRYDIQLKGSGRTPFSRAGDGRAALGPVLREYILSEAMVALGVPTTRSLAAVMTGEPVYREGAIPGAVLTRVAKSHLRVGTFQYFFAKGDVESTRTLAEYAIARHYPEAASSPKPIGALLDGVIARQSKLVAQWMLIGFLHGVMNTDNTSISGETIDYGPCAFMEAYDPATVFSSIDRQGRYNYSNQPHAMHWNMARFAETLLPLLAEEEGSQDAALAAAYAALENFGKIYEEARDMGMRAKLGLTEHAEDDDKIINDLLERMATNHVDFTLFFRRLSDATERPEAFSDVRLLFDNPAGFDVWETLWRQRLAREDVAPHVRAAQMRSVSPALIPRNHIVEAALQAAITQQDFQPFAELVDLLAHPFDDRPKNDPYTQPARPEQYVYQTFCGT